MPKMQAFYSKIQVQRDSQIHATRLPTGSEVRIRQASAEQPVVEFTDEYDFGDSWQHEIVLEKTLEPEPKVRYPRCVEGERACPPEDCGGVWGYAEFLDAIADPKHESHEDMLEWIGGVFDSERFDLDGVDRELRKL